ncbi:site-specific integrase [Metallumcola ferriviriculae]|uniref:Site-specific integrase n=1 Tax=Metallumcola ferriviriculae TaxID=3039180 RepID=A0AAU0UQV1_9FIRM|nr:site-specific integrase [Desulfitibacteraceae bacterium MK1]
MNFTSYMKTVKNYQPRSFNAKLAALIKLNEFLVSQGIQTDTVVSQKDKIKLHDQVSPTEVIKKDVDQFRQVLLEKEGRKFYTIATLLAYCGLRVSECLNIKKADLDFKTRELVVSGKGEKRRVIYMGDKITAALREYRAAVEIAENDYIFKGDRNSKRMNRSYISRIFSKHSDTITPHQLRHFFCSHALENVFQISEVAAIAGHSNIATTSTYLHWTKKQVREKMNSL